MSQARVHYCERCDPPSLVSVPVLSGHLHPLLTGVPIRTPPISSFSGSLFCILSFSLSLRALYCLLDSTRPKAPRNPRRIHRIGTRPARWRQPRRICRILRMIIFPAAGDFHIFLFLCSFESRYFWSHRKCVTYSKSTQKKSVISCLTGLSTCIL